MNKKPEIVRVYLPPDANTLLSTYDHCLRSRQYVNVVVAGKQPQADWLSVEEAALHCARGVGHLGVGGHRGRRRRPAGRRARLRRRRPDAGDAGRRVDPARRELPDLRVRVVNVVDLMRLLPESEHPHGLPDREFDTLFTDGPARHLRLPRLPLARAPAHLPAPQPRQPPRPRLQGGGHDHDAVRHGHAQRPRPLPPRDGRRSTACPASARRRPGCASGMVDARLRARTWTRKHGEDIPEVSQWVWPL